MIRCLLSDYLHLLSINRLINFLSTLEADSGAKGLRHSAREVDWQHISLTRAVVLNYQRFARAICWPQ